MDCVAIAFLLPLALASANELRGFGSSFLLAFLCFVLGVKRRSLLNPFVPAAPGNT